MTVHEFVTGMIEQRTAKGILVDKSWCSVSKFKPIELPPLGTMVKVGVDNKQFIVSIEVLDQDKSSRRREDSTTEVTSTRLAVLQAAAHFAAGRSDIKSSDVLRIAESWLTWVSVDDRHA